MQRQLRVILEDKRRREHNHSLLKEGYDQQARSVRELEAWQMDAQSQIVRLEEQKHSLQVA